MSTVASRAARARRALLLALVAGVATGFLLDRSRQPTPTPAVEATAPVREAVPAATGDAVATLFARGVALMQDGDAGAAARMFHRLVALEPAMPEARVNLGFALLADGRAGAARGVFTSAIDLRPAQVNAYWGLAVALESDGDLGGALGAMRSYVHLTRADDPFLPRARAALWEWEAALLAGDAAPADGAHARGRRADAPPEASAR